ncbi:MAG: sensor histidine kinase [Lewinella sp.]
MARSVPYLSLLFLTLLCTCVRAQNDVLQNLDSLGRFHIREGRTDSAFAVFTRHLRLAQRLNNYDQQRNAHRSLAEVHQKTGSREGVYRHMKLQLDLATKWKNTEDQIIALADFAFNFNSGPRQNIDSARLLLSQARSLIIQDSGRYANHLPRVYFQLANSYVGERDFETALPLYRQALRGAYTEQERYIGHKEIGSTLMSLDRNEEATKELVIAYRMAKETGRRDTSLLHYYLADAYRGRGLADSVFYHLNQYSAGLHASATKRRQRAIVEMETKYDTREREAEISRRGRIITAGAIGLILLSGLLWRLYVQRGRIRHQAMELRSALADKETLLKEIHHRVKNNLQMVSTLLSLQSDYIEDGAALNAIRMGQSRVRSMAVLHQNLYLRDEVTTLMDGGAYLRKLVAEIVDTLNVSNKNITLTLDLESIELDIDVLVPLGLISNEVVTNAMKYAYKDRSEGLLKVSLQRSGKTVQLLIADDGPDAPAETGRDSDAFGQLLVSSLAEQLKGKVTHRYDSGRVVELRFGSGE